jgi:hypothetical protein
MKKNKTGNNIQHPTPSILQHISWYFLASFFIIAFVYFFWFSSYILFFQEQQYLFIYSFSYLSDLLSKPGGLLDLSGKFLTQFYISRFAGSVIIAGILTLPGIILINVNRKLEAGKGFSNLFLILPSCLLLLMQTHYYHMMIYNLGFLLVLLYFMISILSEKIYVRYITLAVFPLFFWFTGAYALLFLGLFIIYSLLYLKGPNKYYYPFFLISVAAISVFVFDRIFLLQSVKQLFLYPLPFINNPTHKVLFYLITAFIVLYPLLLRISNLTVSKKPDSWIVRLIPSILVISVTIVMLITGYNPQTSRVINLEKLVFEEKWEKAVEFQEKHPSENMIGQYFYNIALSESGQLCDRLFFGRQDFGPGSLFLPWSSEHINWGAYAFYTTGLINEAQRWAYEEMVVYGPRPQNMKLLLKSSLINGKFNMAEKYTGILKNTLFYRRWAKINEKLIGDSAAIRSHPDLGRKVRILPAKDFFIYLDSPENNLPELVDDNPENREAFEYMMSYLLLSKEVEVLINNIRLMKDMGYNKIPRHIEEAIMIYYNNKGLYPDLGGLQISSETQARFDEYFNAYINARQNPATLQETMKEQFSNTFWYYFHFK